MRWQGVYVPLLPDLMLDFLQSPVPYILGLHATAYADAASQGLLPDDAVTVNLDSGKVSVPLALQQARRLQLRSGLLC